MLKKVCDALDKWGYYLLALLCAAAILLSALWTNGVRGEAPPEMRAAADQSEQLSDVRFREDAAASAVISRPCDGGILRAFSAEAVFLRACATWRTHEAIDFSCGDADDVRALRAGRVTLKGDGEILVDHGDGCVTVYRGVREILAASGASVAAGETIARGGTPLHGGDSGVCVAYRIDDSLVDFFDLIRIEKD